MAKATKKKEYTKVVTPIGIISYPYLAAPDTGRKESSNKFSIEVLVPKDVWAKEGKPVVEGVLKVAREYFKNPKLKFGEFHSPITDMDTTKDCPEHAKGHIRIRAKASPERKPTVIGPRKDPETGKFPELSEEEVKAIKGGDFGRFIGNPFGYDQQGGGVSIGLNFVQFAREGKAIGQGKMKQLEDLEEIEVGIDDLEDTASQNEVDSDDDEDPMKQFA